MRMPLISRLLFTLSAIGLAVGRIEPAIESSYVFRRNCRNV